jgi:hypothetical protein
LDVAQQLGCAIAAAPAARAHAELEGELVERAGSVARALAHGFLGHGIADADVQTILLNEKYYQLISIFEQ